MQHAILSIKKLKYNLNTYIVCSDSTNEPTKNTMQTMQPMTPRTIDPVSGLSICGGILRMTDDVEGQSIQFGQSIQSGQSIQTIRVDSPKTVECIARAKWYSKFQSDAAASAKFIGRRSKQTTHTSYMPSTNPKFSQHVRTMDAIQKVALADLAVIESSTLSTLPPAGAAGAADIDIHQAAIVVCALKSMRIRLLVDPIPMTVDELRAFCAEVSCKEALSYAAYAKYANRNTTAGGLGGGCDVHGVITYGGPPPPAVAASAYAYASSDGADIDAMAHGEALLAEYNFVKQTRVDLEVEIQRCQRRSFAKNAVCQTPTPHARIAPLHRNMLRNILSPDTLKRAFISVPALTAAVGNDIERFLTWQSHGPDRLAVVRRMANGAMRCAHTPSSAQDGAMGV